MSILDFLYRYIFRGIGVLFLIGMITILLLAIRWQMRTQGAHRPAPTSAVEERAQ